MCKIIFVWSIWSVAWHRLNFQRSRRRAPDRILIVMAIRQRQHRNSRRRTHQLQAQDLSRQWATRARRNLCGSVWCGVMWCNAITAMQRMYVFIFVCAYVSWYVCLMCSVVAWWSVLSCTLMQCHVMQRNLKQHLLHIDITYCEVGLAHDVDYRAT